jgi:hypothetical protein
LARRLATRRGGARGVPSLRVRRFLGGLVRPRPRHLRDETSSRRARCDVTSFFRGPKRSTRVNSRRRDIRPAFLTCLTGPPSLAVLACIAIAAAHHAWRSCHQPTTTRDLSKRQRAKRSSYKKRGTFPPVIALMCRQGLRCGRTDRTSKGDSHEQAISLGERGDRCGACCGMRRFTKFPVESDRTLGQHAQQRKQYSARGRLRLVHAATWR